MEGVATLAAIIRCNGLQAGGGSLSGILRRHIADAKKNKHWTTRSTVTTVAVHRWRAAQLRIDPCLSALNPDITQAREIPCESLPIIDCQNLHLFLPVRPIPTMRDSMRLFVRIVKHFRLCERVTGE